jgi:hypothetical protein
MGLSTTRYKVGRVLETRQTEKDDGLEHPPAKWIPVGENSKVQKSLGLSEGYAAYPARPNLGASCAGRGLPVQYYAEPVQGAAPIAVLSEEA